MGIHLLLDMRFHLGMPAGLHTIIDQAVKLLNALICNVFSDERFPTLIAYYLVLLLLRYGDISAVGQSTA